MRVFDYTKYKNYTWDNEIMGLVSIIHEYRGRQTLYLAQKPNILDKLTQIAKIQSTESSNAIEGIRTTTGRLKQLVEDKTTPKNRDEQEITGYRYVLDIIHENYDLIPITTNYILQLHRDLFRFTSLSISGHFKNGQNQIVSIDEEGKGHIVFTPLAPYDTPRAMDQICEQYNYVVSMEMIDPLIMIPIFIHDFLCIHPFNDGNGRMSRLLTTLLLYRSGYVVGRYVSLEKKISETKNVYYNTLNQCQDGWTDGEEDVTAFIKYILQTVVAAYRDFEDRISIVEEKRSAVDQVREAIEMKIGKFTKSEIKELCPGIGKTSIEKALTTLVGEGYIVRGGRGRATYYVRADAITKGKMHVV